MESERKISSWLSHHEITIAIIGAIATFIWTAHSFDARMQSVDERMLAMEQRVDGRMLAQEQRIDRLYEMFVDLVKAKAN